VRVGRSNRPRRTPVSSLVPVGDAHEIGATSQVVCGAYYIKGRNHKVNRRRFDLPNE
jgi:hypothetical protein